MFYIEILLILAADVGGNSEPGLPPLHQKVVLGFLHQGDSRTGESSSMPCAGNALYLICFFTIKKVSVCKSANLDYIIEK